jgi:chromosome segregation ATPase
MSYIELKQELEKLLSEDLSNRHSLQEMRRNVFLNAEHSQKSQSVIAEKESEIFSLRSAVSEKESDILSQQAELEKMRAALEEERNAFEASKDNYLAEISALQNSASELQSAQEQLTSMKEEAGNLSIENTHFAAKIRELIFHIDEQNTQKEKQEKEIQNLRDTLKTIDSEKKQLAFDLSESSTKEESITSLNEELESTKTRVILLEAQRQTAIELIQAQNATIAQLENNLKAIEDEFSFVVDKFIEEKDLLVNDNAELIAEMGAFTLENEDLYAEQKSLQAKVHELQLQIEEFADSLSELRSKEQIILSLEEEKERLNGIISELNNKPYVDEESYTSQIGMLNAEIISLTNSLEELNSGSRLKIGALEFEKNNLLLKLEDLEKQAMTAGETRSENAGSDNEVFIDKLLQQINLLNEEKSLLQTENEEAHLSLERLQSSCSELTQTIENQKNLIENLEETNKQTKLAETFLGLGSDKASLKLKINELVREIDKCIALLSV